VYTYIMNTQECIEPPTAFLLDTMTSTSIVIPPKDEPPTTPPCVECVECSICLECLTCVSVVKFVLPCSHEFHDSCIQTWLETKKTCPICRMNIKNESPPEPRNLECVPWRTVIKYLTCLSIFLIFIFCVKIL
jgi:hypothetical protein